MNKKQTVIPAIIAGILIGSLGYMGVQEASAHQRITDLPFGTIIIGHDEEPSFGHKPGVWLGKHNTEVFLRDNADNPIIDIEGLLVDKYYFKDVKKYNKAKSLEKADAISLNNPLNQVFGESGTYHSEQIVKAGIYGYRVHGDVNDFLVDVTLFCATEGMDDKEKFENADEGTKLHEFTCQRNIDDIKFPRK